MSQPALATIVGTLRRSARPKAETARSDHELLAAFVSGRDEEAFRALVARYGKTVLAACRQVLADPADADDAFQATFLVLLKKAKNLDGSTPLGGWLFGVAHRVAVRCRADAHRRRAREAEAATRKRAAVELPDLSWREAAAVLHEELNALPDKYRLPLLLCSVQGLTRDEAAEQLGTTVGAIRGQIERGRALLERRLKGRGVVLSAGLLAVLVGSSRAAAVPPVALIDQTVRSAGGHATAAVAALTHGAFPMTTILKRTLMTVMLVAGFVGAGVGFTSHAATADDAKQPDKMDKPKPDAKGDRRAEEPITIQVVDADGKPLAGATVYRSGSTRTPVPTAEAVVGTTGADGKLVAEWTPLTAFHATADGYCAGASGFLDGPIPVTIRLAKPLPIKGRLVNLEGKPVAKAKVIVESVAAAENDDLTAAYNSYRVNPEMLSGLRTYIRGTDTGAPKGTTTDADGRFELAGVGKLRVVRLRFEAEGIERARAVVFADPEFEKRMTPRTDADKRMAVSDRDFRLATHGPEFTHAAHPDHVITGTVTDPAGKPVAGLKVVGTALGSERLLLSRYSAWSEGVEATTDKDGKFRLAGLVKAKLRHLHVQGGDSAPYLDQVVEVADTTGYTPVTGDVTLRPAVLVTGRLTNRATGKPVRGLATWLPLEANTPLLQKETGYAALYTGEVNAAVTGTQAATDADGKFTLRVPPGLGVVLARGDALDPAAVFAPLRVRDEDQKYVRKRKVPDPITASSPQPRDDEEGFATIERGFRRVVSRTKLENGYAIINPDVKAKTAEVSIAFDPGATVTLAVTDPDGKPLGGVTVIGRSQAVRTPTTFAKPEVAIGGFHPKSQPVQMYLLHKERKLCGGVMVKGDEKGPVAVKLVPCGSVTGTVVDHTGKAVKGALVRYQMTDYTANDLVNQTLFRGENEVRTDADGKFTFPRMFPDVEFMVSVGLPGIRRGVASQGGMSLKPGEAKTVGELKIRDPKKPDDE